MRRIVVVFGGGSSNHTVAGALASLASEGVADIAAVFLEDHALFRLAELPFTTEICRVTTTQRPLTVGGLERQMKVQASWAEQAVRRVAEHVGSSWSFRRHRGRLGAALAGARDVDVLLLGTGRRSLAPSGELRAMARAVRSDEVEPLRPAAVLLDRADTAIGSLDAGVRLAATMGRGLIVFLSDEVAEAFPDLALRLEPLGPKRASIRHFSGADLETLFAELRRATPAILIVSAGDAEFEDSGISALQRQLSCPIVVVRATTP